MTQVYKLGLKPERSPAPPALMFSEILRAVPAHPAAADNLAKERIWQMLGNDEYGDCVAVALANQIRAVTQGLAKKVYPSESQVLRFYETQNPDFPAQDDGMDLQQALGDLLHAGFPSRPRRRCVAFAKLHPTHEDELEAAIAIFGSVVLGLEVQAGNLDDFDEGRPWSDHGQPPEGGHAVLAGGYKKGESIRFVTWAQETTMGLDYLKSSCVQAWAVIYLENFGTVQFQDGIDVPALRIAYQNLTGRVLPLPTGEST